MPITFKTKTNNFNALHRAARRRAQDAGLGDLTAERIDVLVTQYLQFQRKLTFPAIGNGQVLSSHAFREFLRDAKFFAGLNSSELVELETDIRNSSKDGFGLLADIQQEANALNSQLSEEEIKLLGNFDSVHFNSFVRQRDMGLSFTQKDWLSDYKTESSFLVDNIANIIPGAGVTLPVRDNVRVPIVGAVLVGEETDVGDTPFPVVSNDPRNVFLVDKVFRYVIIRNEHDATSRKFNYAPSYCTIQLELPNLQEINYINIKPISQRGLTVEEISFVNESGESVPLDVFELNIETIQTLLFEPVKTRYLKLKLQAHAPVTKTEYNAVEWSKKELNNILRGAGWSVLLEEKEQLVQGRVYDFSIENIAVGLIVYEPLGVYRSRPMKVRSPVGVSISERSEAIQVTSNQRSYGIDFNLPEGVVLNEYYLGVHLKTVAGHTAMRDLIPIPDSYPVQREFLPLVGSEAKVKLFPDMLWNVEKFRALAVDWSSYTGRDAIKFTTEEPHGYLVGDEILVLGPVDYPLVGTHIVAQVNAYEFKVEVSALLDTQIATEATVPRIFVAKVSAQDAPLIIKVEDDLLTVGKDYQLSYDGGSTWSNEFSRAQIYTDALTDPSAGNFKIKMLNPVYDKIYWIQYRPLKNQSLSKDKTIRLKNGRVVFDISLRDTIGTISTVIISRAENSNPQVTPVVLFYALKVRENVS